MALIATNEKVFMVDTRTNTIYGGSAALQAMQQWYTMQDVIDTVTFAGNVASLQAVTAIGNTTTFSITSTITGNGTAIQGNSEGGTGVFGSSQTANGVEGSTYTGAAVKGEAQTTGVGGRFISDQGIGVLVSSNDSYGIDASSVNGTAIRTTANNYGWGVYATGAGGGVYAYGRGGSSDPGLYALSDGDYAIVSAGDAAKPGGGSWTASSDSRVKEKVKPYTKGLTEILLVNPVNYEYNGLAGTTKGKEFTGVIAQEIKDIFPETVNTYKAKLNEEDKETTDLYNFESTALTFALINAVKELKAEIDLLKAK
jgi:hypothetical protein